MQLENKMSARLDDSGIIVAFKGKDSEILLPWALVAVTGHKWTHPLKFGTGEQVVGIDLGSEVSADIVLKRKCRIQANIIDLHLGFRGGGKMKARHTLCLLVVLLSGCCPVLYTKHPGYTGRIVYADSQMPVSGADASLKKILRRMKDGYVVSNIVEVASDTTDTNGVFYIKAPRGLGIYIFPEDVFPLQYRLDLSLNGEVFRSSAYSDKCLGGIHFHDLGVVIWKSSRSNDVMNQAFGE